jgi:hypothetical protein
MKIANVILVFLMLVILLVACGPVESPTIGAKEWTEAQLNLDGTRLMERTCASHQLIVQAGGALTSAINILAEQFIGQQDIKVDMSGLRYETISQSNDIAQVRVHGKIIVAVLAFAQTQQLDVTYTMVFEDGKWKWCGESGASNELLMIPTVVGEALTSKEDSSAIQGTPLSTLIPSKTIDLSPVGYAFTLESGNDGWAYGQVALAFTNTTDHTAIVEDLDVEPYVETEEGQTYPAVVFHDEYQPSDYEASPSHLKISLFTGFPPGFIARNVWPIGWFGTNNYVVYFRVAEITHPTRIVFPSLPNWTINLEDAYKADPGYPGQAIIDQALPISSLAGHTIDEIPNKASMFLDGTCIITNDYYTAIRLNYTIENMDNFNGVEFSGDLGSVAIEWSDGEFAVSHPLVYNLEVGPGQTVHEYFEIDNFTYHRYGELPPGFILVLYDRLSNESRGYSIITLDSCSHQ